MNTLNLLKYMRNQTGLEQKDIAKQLNRSVSSISGYEIGDSRISFEKLLEFAQVCDYEIIARDKNSGETITIKPQKSGAEDKIKSDESN